MNNSPLNTHTLPLATKSIFNQYSWVDLTHKLMPRVPTWDGHCGFNVHTMCDYSQGLRVQRYEMRAGIGTHMDAPAHFIAGGLSIADIPLNQLIVPAYVLNVAHKADANYAITPEDILEYEQSFGLIPQNSLVIAYSGWSVYWDDAERYRNEDASGQMHFPTFSAASAELLLERGIAGIGIDTLSPDIDPAFPVHHILLGSGKYIIENIANAELLPARGAYAIALPLNIVDGTESPIRLIGLYT